MLAVPCDQHITIVKRGERKVVGIAEGFGGHEFVLEIDGGDFFDLGSVIQFFQFAEKRTGFCPRCCVGDFFQFVKHHYGGDQPLIRFWLDPPIAWCFA